MRWWGERLVDTRRPNRTNGGGGSPFARAWKHKLAQQYVTLANEWSGLPRPVNGRGCAIDPPPRGIGVGLLPRPPIDAEGVARAAPLPVPRASNGGQNGGKQPTRYLVYQPPSGLGEWFISLRNAIGIAKTLGRVLVVPHMLWDGALTAPIAYSTVYSWPALQALVPNAMEADEFLKLGLVPRSVVLLHVKDPRLLPSRAYFDTMLHWFNSTSVHMPAQMASSADYLRLYGACDETVLAISHAYAGFEGFAPWSKEQAWLDEKVYPALWSDTPAVVTKAKGLIDRLRRDTGRYTCIHMTDLDTAILTSRGLQDSKGGFNEPETSLLDVDVAEPAAHSVPFGGHTGYRMTASVCEGYDSEAQSTVGRQWVRQLYDQGFACEITDEIVGANLPRLPPKDPILVLTDGLARLPETVSDPASTALKADFLRFADLVGLTALAVKPEEWQALEQAVCASADALMINEYSPLSQMIWRRASAAAASPKQAGGGPKAASLAVRKPSLLRWLRVDSDACLPLFTRTARFDIQPNRFGILGQFGPDRKLQLATTNLTTMVGWDGRLVPNATIELEVYVSNETHSLYIFEYTKENNRQGINIPVPPPAGGWREHTWHSLVIPLGLNDYSYPASTPWEAMDRLELYYSSPHPAQKHGDYIRMRNVYVRSTRSFRRLAGDGSRALRERQTLACRELDLSDRLRRLKAFESLQASEQSSRGSQAAGARAMRQAQQLGGDLAGGGAADGVRIRSGDGFRATRRPHKRKGLRNLLSLKWLALAGCVLLVVIANIVYALSGMPTIRQRMASCCGESRVRHE